MDENRVTIYDIAKMANVSGMTVSRAIRTPELVKRSTLRRIQSVRAFDYFWLLLLRYSLLTAPQNEKF